jgi:TonB family protein
MNLPLATVAASRDQLRLGASRRGVRTHLSLLAAVSVLLNLATISASAELLCDCTQVVDTCSASVGLDGTSVSIRSDSSSCSRVDYLIEGQPFTALVVGGGSELGWPGLPQRNADIVVESCRVCLEAGSNMQAAVIAQTTTATDGADQELDLLQPIIKVMPEYPRAAWMNRLEGDVAVDYSVVAGGAVKNIRVARSTNRAFDIPAIDAVRRFRFAPLTDEDSARTELREEFRFRLLDSGTLTSVSSVSSVTP